MKRTFFSPFHTRALQISRVFVGLAFSLALMGASACSKYRIKDDPSPDAVSVNALTADFFACGKHFQGQGACFLPPDYPYNSIDLRLPVIYKGSYRVVSEDLGIDIFERYDSSGIVRINLPLESDDDPVLLSIAINPEYPREENQDVVIYGMRAVLWVVPYQATESWSYALSQKGQSVGASITINTKDKHTVYVESCNGESYLVTPTGDKTTVRTSDLLQLRPHCAYSVATLGENEDKVSLVAWLVNLFDDSVHEDGSVYSELPNPSVYAKGKWLYAMGSDSVALVVLDTRHVIGSGARFTWDPKKPHALRFYTVKGRLKVADYTPQRGWTWIK